MACPTPPDEVSLSWSSVFTVAPRGNKSLPGDKILLPQSALEQLLAASTVTVTSNAPRNRNFDPFNPYSLAAARAEQSQWQDTRQQLPHPLIFRLVNTENGNVVFAGIREFSAGEGEIGLSPFLLEALGVTEPEPSSKSNADTEAGHGTSDAPIDLTDNAKKPPRIMVHAKQLPRGKYVRLRPLEAGYNPEDWKALLERHLRENYTTLTSGQILSVRGSRSEEFRFLIDKFLPEGDGICVVDTDLEVDIEALNEEQARETMRQIMTKAQRASGTAEGSSAGGKLNVWKPYAGQIADGEYIDFQLPSWDRSQAIEVELTIESDQDIDLFVSPLSSHQRAKPREDEHIWSSFTPARTKRIEIQPSNVELEGAEALLVSLYARSSSPGIGPRQFSLRVGPLTYRSGTSDKPIALDADVDVHGPDEEQCKNCHQWVPKRTMMLHENFCLRNNVLCPQCQNVFQKKSQEWQDHWHCAHGDGHGDSTDSKQQHDGIFHTPRQCPNCPYEAPSLVDMARHRTSVCPGKLILCQFCHLGVPQEGDPFNPSSEQLISGLTAHELVDGTRTTECHLCSKIVRLRDMTTHLKHHDLEKNSRRKPAICRNINCGRTLDGVGKNGEIGAGTRMGQGPGNDLGLCSICFGPLYVSMHDPEGKAMKRRIERRYLSQLITGCGKAWCQNEYCKTARSKNNKAGPALTTKDALPLVTPLMNTLSDLSSPMYFCVDDSSQGRRQLAEMLAAEGVYELEWCIAACEAEAGKLDGARTWLQNWAPTKK